MSVNHGKNVIIKLNNEAKKSNEKFEILYDTNMHGPFGKYN